MPLTRNRFWLGSQRKSARRRQVSWAWAEITPRPSRSSAISLSLSSACVIASARNALDVGAAGGELLLQPLEAAIEVINAIDRRFALGGERGDHQRNGCAQIGRHNRGAEQLVDALDDRRIAVELDAGAEPRELLDVHE